MAVRTVNWNVEWARPGSAKAKELLARILAKEPEVVCLTEAYEEFLTEPGFTVASEPDYGYPMIAGRRKVVLWSRHPWSDVDRVGERAIPGGRYVAGRTKTTLGDLHVIGVCIPSREAHVRTGRRGRERWEEHLSYLVGLRSILDRTPHESLIVIGDFNQTIPRTRAPERVHAALSAALGDRLVVATAGSVGGGQLIDHIVHSPDLVTREVSCLSNQCESAGRLSDHVGVVAELVLR